MITGTQLREIRENFGLKIREVSRATFISEGAISNIEKDTRQPSLDTLKVIANFYGYEVDLNLVEKKSFNKKINFYKPKTAREILSLNKEDLVEYVFVTQSDEVISRIVNIDIDTLRLINLGDLKNILDEHIRKTDNLVVYYKINNLYSDIEIEVAETVDHFKRNLSNNIDDNNYICPAKFLSSIYYIDLNIDYDYEYEEWDTYSYDIKMYDKNMNLLSICNCEYEEQINTECCNNCDIEEVVREWRGENISN